jgi:hypothetical protein
VLGAVIVVVGAAAVVAGVITWSRQPRHTKYSDLVAGDCFTQTASRSGRSFTVDRVPCTRPHDVEVVGTFRSTATGSGDSVAARTIPRCQGQAKQYLGHDPPITLRLVWLLPTGSVSGSYRVVCGLQNADRSRATGSLRA